MTNGVFTAGEVDLPIFARRKQPLYEMSVGLMECPVPRGV